MPDKEIKRPFYLLVSIDIEDPEEYAKYRENSGPLLATTEGTVMIGNENSMIVYEGEYKSNHLVLMKWDCREDYEEFYYSEGYQDNAKPHRIAGATTNYIIGFDQLDW